MVFIFLYNAFSAANGGRLVEETRYTLVKCFAIGFSRMILLGDYKCGGSVKKLVISCIKDVIVGANISGRMKMGNFKCHLI